MPADVPSATSLFPRGFANTPACLLVIELPAGRITDANQAFVNLFGYPLSFLRGRTVAEAGLWPEAKKRPREQLFGETAFDNVEVRWRTHSGAPLDVALTTDIVEHAGARFAVCLVRPRQLHTDAPVRDAGPVRHDALFSRVHAAVACGQFDDAEGAIKLDMNERFRALLEVGQDLPAGRMQWDVLCEVVPALADARRQLETAGELSFLNIWVPNIGKIIDVHVARVDDSYFVVTAEDATDRRRNEDAILRLNEQLRSRMQYQKAQVEGLLGSNEAFLYALAARMQDHLATLTATDGLPSAETDAVKELYGVAAQVMRYASARYMSYRRGLVDVSKVVERLVLDMRAIDPAVSFGFCSMLQVTAAEQPLETIMRNLFLAFAHLPREGAELNLHIGVQSEFLDSVFSIQAQTPEGAVPLTEESVDQLQHSVEYCVAQRVTLLHGGTMSANFVDGELTCRFTVGTPTVGDAGVVLSL